MEVQQPQTVQINFNNKLITLHNVTVVKNPKIITISATQYSNLLKGSQVKLSNGSASTNALKVPVPSLTPFKNGLPSPTTLSFRTVPTVSVGQRPLIVVDSEKASATTTVPKLVANTAPAQVFKALPTQNGFLRPTASLSISSPSSLSQINVQSASVKQPPTVIINPPKKCINASQLKIQVKSPAPQQQASTVLLNTVQTSVQSQSSPSKIGTTASKRATNVISPPVKSRKTSCTSSPPEPKRLCTEKTNLEFHCIFCKNVFIDAMLLMDHMKTTHADSMQLPVSPDDDQPMKVPNIFPTQSNEFKKENESDENLSAKKNDVIGSPGIIKPKSESESSSDDYDDGDDDESEVNDLIMDIENASQASSLSDQERSETPESPEFEEHIPLAPIKEESEEDDHEQLMEFSNDLDYENYEYSSIMEPICELDCVDDSMDCDDNSPANEAMRLYRAAMEENYQKNGIKKRGRRKTRVARPLEENTTLNGILAGLLEDPALKIPPGPGRGRRKEMNEQEMEIVNSGVCFFQCNFLNCDKSFKFAGDLAKHVRSHTISSPYQCSICQRKFTHIGSLNTHLRIHSGERPYKCNQCEKSFTQSNSLMVHVKSHLSSKPFQCHQCNKGFLNASSLTLHQKTHTGPTVVTCLIEGCGKEFRDNNLLEEHMQTHKQSMLYQCSLCSERFEQACLLVQHVKSHIGDKPFSCSICEKSFTQPGSLNTHLRIHTGEKPFQCQQCNKAFTQASSLSVHMKVHGEKEFTCTIESCKKSYSQLSYLKKHIETRHEISK